jgi:hypothetical protein
MANATYYLTPNAAGTAFMGTGYTPDGTLPKSAIPCTKEQAQNWQQLVPSNGEIVAAPDAVLLAQAQATQKTLVTQGYNTATDYVPVTINGTTYQVDSTAGKQALNLSLAITANAMMQSPAWAASTEYAAGSYCSVNGVILFCSTAGESGTSAPTPPTTFGTPVTDGTAAWELLGRKVYLQGGSFVYMTPQQIMSAFQQGELYLHQMSDQLESLKAEINAATTVSAVQTFTF